MANHDQTHKAERSNRRWVNAASIGAFTAWLAAAGIALGAIADYASKPGVAAPAPTSWPTESRLARSPGRATLVMIAHTKCACTRASLHELERVMARAGSRAEAFVVFVGPSESTGTAGLLDLRSTARAIPGVRVVEDANEARLFGAATSGQVVVYDDHGSLVFRGGITSARGHEGDSAGNEAVRRFVVTGVSPAGSASNTSATEVFGCALFDNHNATSGVKASGSGKEP